MNNRKENKAAANDENCRTNQGYRIIDSAIVAGKWEYVLGENPHAPDPYATWERNLQNDAQSGGEHFYWGIILEIKTLLKKISSSALRI